MRYRSFEASLDCWSAPDLGCWFAPDAERLTRSVKTGSRYILKEIRETAQDEKQGLESGGRISPHCGNHGFFDLDLWNESKELHCCLRFLACGSAK